MNRRWKALPLAAALVCAAPTWVDKPDPGAAVHGDRPGPRKVTAFGSALILATALLADPALHAGLPVP